MNKSLFYTWVFNGLLFLTFSLKTSESTLYTEEQAKARMALAALKHSKKDSEGLELVALPDYRKTPKRKTAKTDSEQLEDAVAILGKLQSEDVLDGNNFNTFGLPADLADIVFEYAQDFGCIKDLSHYSFFSGTSRNPVAITQDDANNPLIIVPYTSRDPLDYYCDYIKIWNLSGKRPYYSKVGHTGCINCLTIVHDTQTNENIIASGSPDGTIKLWNIKDACLRATIETPRYNVKALAEGRDDNNKTIIAAALGPKGHIGIWDLSGNRRCLFQPHSKTVTALGYGTDQHGKTILVSGSEDGTICISGPSGELTRKITQGPDRLNKLAVEKDIDNKTIIVSGSAKGCIKLWDLEGNCLHTLIAAGPAVLGLVVKKEDDQVIIVAGLENRSIQGWNSKGQQIFTVHDKSYKPTGLAIGKDETGKTIVVSTDLDGDRKTIKILGFMPCSLERGLGCVAFKKLF